MDTFENQNNRHSEELAAKVSRLKHVSLLIIFNILSTIFFIYFFFKIAFDIENETKEHNRFLESMVKYKLNNLNK
jgi:dolichyl-phosphate-mannose--protein O-mannosyl transferase